MEERKQYFIKTFSFFMQFNSKYGQFYQNLVSDYITFMKMFQDSNDGSFYQNLLSIIFRLYIATVKGPLSAGHETMHAPELRHFFQPVSIHIFLISGKHVVGTH